MCVCHSFIKTAHVYNRNVSGVFFLSLKGVQRDFRFQVFSWISFPQALVGRPFRIYLKFCCSRYTTNIVATGFNNTSSTGGNLTTVSLIPVANFLLVLVTPVANLPPVSLIPVVHLDFRISPQIFRKNLIDPNVIFRGWNRLLAQSPSTRRAVFFLRYQKN